MIEIGIIKDKQLNKIIDIRDKNQVIKAKYAIGKDYILKCSYFLCFYDINKALFLISIIYTYCF